MGTAKKLIQRFVTKTVGIETECQTKSMGELLQEQLLIQNNLEQICIKLKQKLSSEESLHEMTKDKLQWLGKDKIKLLKQLGSLNQAYKELDEEYGVLRKQYIECQRENKEKDVKIDMMDKELEKAKDLKVSAENITKMLKVEVTSLRSKGPLDKTQQAMDNRINYLEGKLEEEIGVKKFIYFLLNKYRNKDKVQEELLECKQKILSMEKFVTLNLDKYNQYRNQNKSSLNSERSKASKINTNTINNPSRTSKQGVEISQNPTNTIEGKY